MSTDVPTPRSPIDRLRDELAGDAQLLQALPPGSDAHDRLSEHIEERTRELLDRIDEKEAADRRFREAMRAEQAAQRLSPNEEARIGSALCILIGAIVTYTGWGTWWLVLAVILFITGIVALIGSFDPEDNPSCRRPSSGKPTSTAKETSTGLG